MVALTQTKIEEYKEKTPTTFLDYVYFEDKDEIRQPQIDAFLSDKTYFPAHFYPKLDGLSHNMDVTKEKTAIYKAGLELEEAKKQPGVDLAELNLYIDFFTRRLQMIMLTEAARDLNLAGGSAEQDVAQYTFMDLNEKLFGEFDVPAFRTMMFTEYNRISEFVPASEHEQQIKSQLLSSLESIKSDETVEKPLMDKESLQKLHDVVVERFKVTLDTIPDTDDSVYYNAEECTKIVNDVLEVRGLTAKGWKAVIYPESTIVSTQFETKEIRLPSSTNRNARELRRLIVHEVEVHAFRAQNGSETGFKILTKGTAGYLDIEEGLGILLECALENSWDNPSLDRARDRYITAGLALGSDSEEPRNAHDVEDILSKIYSIRQSEDGKISDKGMQKARKQAYAHVENAFRGTEFWMRGIIYMKLKVYYEGLVKNAQYMLDNIDDLNAALDQAGIGKFDHTDNEETANVRHMVTRKRGRVLSAVARAMQGVVNKQN